MTSVYSGRGKREMEEFFTMECKSLLENEALILSHYTYRILILLVM